MHLLLGLVMQESIRGDESIQELMKANSWWIDYLTNEDLRIEYARWILLGPQNEEREVVRMSLITTINSMMSILRVTSFPCFFIAAVFVCMRVVGEW